VCKEHNEATGSFTQHWRRARQETKAITKAKGRPQGAPVWRLPAPKAPAGFCFWEKQPLASIWATSLLLLLRQGPLVQ